MSFFFYTDKIIQTYLQNGPITTKVIQLQTKKTGFKCKRHASLLLSKLPFAKDSGIFISQRYPYSTTK